MSFRRRLACLCLCLGLEACHMSVNVPVKLQNQSSHDSTQTSTDVFNVSNVQFEWDGQTLNSSELNDFMVQTFRGRRGQTVRKILKHIKVKVGDPVHLNDLAPTIESAEIVYDDKDRPARILLKGQNYMVFQKFYYATLNGEFGFGLQTEVFDDGHFETTFHIPEPEGFDASEAHVVVFATPFGLAFQELLP